MPRVLPLLLTALAVTTTTLAEPPQPGVVSTQEPKPAKPAVYSDKSYADALAATKGTNKILIVKATAVWCGPCKMMDRTTFVDDRVVKWFGENGLVIDFDVDQQAELAQSLQISAMPTLIAFKNGKEVDRVVGYRNADAFLGWLDNVRIGKRAGDDLQVKVEKANNGEGAATPRERMQNLRNIMMSNGDLDKATDEAVWLWNNMVKDDPAMYGVRGSFFAQDIERLAQRHPAAKERFSKVRDEAWDSYKADAKNLQALDDWMILNDALNESDKTLEWFDRIKGDPASTPIFDRVGFRLERLLSSNNRIADICRVYPDPMRKLTNDDQLRKSLPTLSDEQQNKSMRQIHDTMFRDGAARMYASLLLAKRDQDAAKFAAEAVKLDDTGAMRAALVRAAVDNRVGHKDLYPMLDAADKSGELVQDLRTQLEQQAGKP